TIIARGEACFSSEQLREMAGIAVAHVERHINDALLCFTEASARSIHPQVDVILRRRHACRTLEQASEMKLAQPGLCRQLIQGEFLRHVLGHPVSDLSKLESRQGRTPAARFFNEFGVVPSEMDGNDLSDALDAKR